MKINAFMPRFSKFMGGFALAVAAAFAFTSCDDDHKPDWIDDNNTPVDFGTTSVSIPDNAVVNSATTSLEVVYDKNIALNPAVDITLNGEAITESRVADNTLVLKLSLRPGKSYVLEVPDRAVVGIGTMTFAKGFTLNFKTEDVVSDFVPLINAKAIQQAVNVHNYLIQVNGQKILSGAMANVNNNNDFPAWVKAKTGKDVAIVGYDFIHHAESTPGGWIDYEDITPATTQWENNGLVSYMWHWRVPDNKEAWENKDYSKYGCRLPADDIDDPTSFDIREALKEGTWEHEVIMQDLAQIAGYLKLLQDRNIPVIWRPLHEAAGSYKYNGAWFWWGRFGDQYTIELWKLMYDELVNKHGLNNLIWVWTAQFEEGYETQMRASYPGNDLVDVVGVDIYADNDGPQTRAYEALRDMTEGKKLITISETGLIQNPDKCLEAGAKWSWFNLWYTYNQHITGGDTDGFGNTAESLNAVMNSPVVLNRSDLPSLK